jgi:type II secretory ATPase GspE/PulE/Tfp pilus assembly ATPase PilB-like protein
MAQRLVRKICPKCKEEYVPDEGIFDDLTLHITLPDKDKIRLYKGKGCDYCKNTGYYGRIAIFEMIEINDEIRSMILRKISSNEIKEVAIRYGMKTLLDSGVTRALEGITSIDEVFRVAV